MYDCFVRAWTIFENDIGAVKERVFFFKKAVGYVDRLENISKSVFSGIIRNLQAGSALLLTRENQAQGLLTLSRLHSNHLGTYTDENDLMGVISQSIATSKNATKIEGTNCYLYNKIFDNMILFQSQHEGLMEDENLKANISIIKSSIEGLRNKEGEEGGEGEEVEAGKKKRKKDLAKHMELNFKRILKFAHSKQILMDVQE